MSHSFELVYQGTDDMTARHTYLADATKLEVVDGDGWGYVFRFRMSGKSVIIRSFRENLVIRADYHRFSAFFQALGVLSTAPSASTKECLY